MILVYTPVIKPRIEYIFKHFFHSRMGNDIFFTSELSTFIAHTGPKMSYGDAPLGNEFFIAAHELLVNQGVDPVEITIFDWDGIPAFFATKTESALPFDFFAASFYLLSRYEEYQPHTSDSLGRYKSEQSLAHQHDFLHLPLVDMWFERFVHSWNNFFQLTPQVSEESSLSLIIDIPQLYRYKHKTFFRSIVEGIEDFFTLRFPSFFDRIMVVLGFRDDPLHGLHQWIMRFQDSSIKLQFFVLYTALGIHDKSLSVFNKTHQQHIKSISDYAPTAPLASIQSNTNSSHLKSDIKRFSLLIHRNIKAIRQHKLVLSFPKSYRTFSALGIRNDYSMQYHDTPGFRASTAFPFRFYDLGDEQQTPLTIHSICLSEAHIREQRYSRKMRQLFLAYKNCLTALHAPFNVALTNESFNSRTSNTPFLATLNKILEHD